jgi:hypothetical protein
VERAQVLELIRTLKLYGMCSAYDEVIGNGIKRQHEPPCIVDELLQSGIAEKQARSIRYQLNIAKLPLAKDIDGFDFTDTLANESLVRELATGTFVAGSAQCRSQRRPGSSQEPPGYCDCSRSYTTAHAAASSTSSIL